MRRSSRSGPFLIRCYRPMNGPFYYRCSQTSSPKLQTTGPHPAGTNSCRGTGNQSQTPPTRKPHKLRPVGTAYRIAAPVHGWDTDRATVVWRVCWTVPTVCFCGGDGDKQTLLGTIAKHEAEGRYGSLECSIFFQFIRIIWTFVQSLFMAT